MYTIKFFSIMANGLYSTMCKELGTASTLTFGPQGFWVEMYLRPNGRTNPPR